MQAIEITSAQNNLAALLKNFDEPFIFAQDGKPLATVTPYVAPPPRPRRIGSMKGQISVPDDFDEMCKDEILAMFLGEEE